MTVPSALERPCGVPFIRRMTARIAVAAAFALSLLPPGRLRAVLALLSRGAGPARYVHAKAARDAVLAVSLTCLGSHGCLPRSLATALLCRIWGVWPTWCAGVRTRPPFAAHAWVEADGRPVDEAAPPGYLSPLITVAPRP
ncbi:lasso peptide biosynthesis B2 protein [Planomonospora sp. ID82291]|uniref:lasso peptide biosynthesis B2 protein n=1 Tax=Planomonospora sp. ID82291 TaxID=2738136 RepID=UPI001A224CEE|nr:lasso peptide biosynthesis B2 protein [Planomonospora sp. ID82291]MBG0816447.1 lasso peptide biosynthesis B2 protein [Planomonospora sp. ID82291]